MSLGRSYRVAITIGLAMVVVVSSWALAAKPKTKLVSVHSNGTQGDAFSFDPSTSGNGRFIAFYSSASNLVAGDTNDRNDVFVHDKKTKKTKRVSVRSNGAQGNGGSDEPAISANGRFIAFYSSASNLVKGDTNFRPDIFVHDRKTKKTTRVNVRSNGAQADSGTSTEPSLSANGRFIAFEDSAPNLVAGDANGLRDIFVHDRKNKKTKLVSVRSNGTQGDGESSEAAISGNGRFIAFRSWAENLVAGDANGAADIFVHDKKTKKTKRVSVRSNGAQGDGSSFEPSISGNGRITAFRSDATDLVAGDTNGESDVFVHDRKTKKTKRVSVRSNGAQGDGSGIKSSISADGRFVAFDSQATNLVAGDTNDMKDIFVHDRKTKKTKRVSVRSNGAQGDDSSAAPSISADGRFVAFYSSATNLAADTNGTADIFLRGPLH